MTGVIIKTTRLTKNNFMGRRDRISSKNVYLA